MIKLSKRQNVFKTDEFLKKAWDTEEDYDYIRTPEERMREDDDIEKSMDREQKYEWKTEEEGEEFEKPLSSGFAISILGVLDTGEATLEEISSIITNVSKEYLKLVVDELVYKKYIIAPQFSDEGHYEISPKGKEYLINFENKMSKGNLGLKGVFKISNRSVLFKLAEALEEEVKPTEKVFEKPNPESCTKKERGGYTSREKMLIADKVKNIMRGQKDAFHVYERITQRTCSNQLDKIFKVLGRLMEMISKNNPPKNGPWFYDVFGAGHFFGVGKSIRSYRTPEMTKTISTDEALEMFKKSSLEEKLNESEILEKTDFSEADLTLVNHLRDSLNTLTNASQKLFEMNLITPEELRTIQNVEENMDDYLLSAQYNRFKRAQLEQFINIINANVKNKITIKLGELRGNKK